MDIRELHDDAVALLQQVDPAMAWQRTQPGRLFAVLRASDALLMKCYLESLGRSMPGIDCEGGEMDFGPILFLLHHPPSEFAALVKLLVKALEQAEGAKLPPSLFAPDSFKTLVRDVKTRGVVAPDGSIWGERKYQQLDPGWLLALAFLTVHELGIAKRHVFGSNPQVIEIPDRGWRLRLAFVGDWGTGRYGRDNGPADAVMRGIHHLQPDYAIHLGDVYYAGTDKEVQHNFLRLWQTHLSDVSSLTLNSNHDMYDGGKGYFDVALSDEGPFAIQQGTSYFALRHGKWLVLGLDSAYYADPERLYMTGNIGPSDGAQAMWVRDQAKGHDPDKVIVLTHHNPVSFTGDELIDEENENGMWQVVRRALGGQSPGYWYFGHIHNGIVYSGSSALGQAGTRGRLAGHGAIPYGLASALPAQLDSGVLEYFGSTRMQDDPPRVRNGFAIIDLLASGEITERFFEIGDQDSFPEQMWP